MDVKGKRSQRLESKLDLRFFKIFDSGVFGSSISDKVEDGRERKEKSKIRASNRQIGNANSNFLQVFTKYNRG